MLYKPLPENRATRKPVGLIAAGAAGVRILTAAGDRWADAGDSARKLIADHAGVNLFSLSPFRSIRNATGSEGWILHRWNRESTVWQSLDGVKVRGTRRIFLGLRPEDAIEALLRIDRQAADYGVTLGSWSSMSMQLWRATLPEPVALAGRDVGKLGFFGGRKELRREYRGLVLSNVAEVDMRAAYPAAMLAGPFPTRLVQRSPSIVDVGISRARVVLPPSPWAQLPERRRGRVIRWESGREIEGWWPNVELRAAAAGGAKVTPLETWTGVRFVEPFVGWGGAVERLRGDDPAGRWWKGVSNALYGVFAMERQRGELLTMGPDEKVVSRTEVPGRKARRASAAYVASIVAGRVRAKLLIEGLERGWSQAAIQTDTDGVMMVGGELPPATREVPQLGEWRVKRIMPKVILRAAQAWGWWDIDGGEHVVMAGRSGATMRDLERVVGRGEIVAMR